MEQQFLKGKKLKFIIVDDDAGVRDIITEMLTISGQEVTSAENGDELIKKIKTKDKNADIILLDIRMPGAKPKEILKEVKNNCKKAAIIYLTSVKAFEPMKEDLKMEWVPELSYPVIGYIEKPVNKEELLKKIEEYLERNETIKNRTTTKKK